ncbi:MAG TPA: MFS transporter [Stellaceae bacterium]|jgi:DHA2 family multidrug resistance protein|nr:MFS transporter [Stellaceae bacterium]
MTAIDAPAPRPSGLPALIGRTEYPVIGVAAVMLGAAISSLNTRITTFGLADSRGGLGLGFDEGSWMTTAFGAAQMVVTPAAAWMSTVLGTRRVLLSTGIVFTIGSLLVPLTHDWATLMALQTIRGLAVGAFIPAALGFVLRSLAPRWWMWGIAAYSFRYVFSQNVAGALEGWYSEAGHWQWIYWQNVPLTCLMLALVWIAMPRRPIDSALWPRTDWTGIVHAGLGFGLVYAGLDQGNRLDWLNSGLICGLLLGGSILIVAFFVHEARTPDPLVHLPVLCRSNVAGPAILISIYGFGSTATGFVLPDYLTRIQGLRDLQIGDTLNWIALPQFVLVPLVAMLMRRVDARLPLVFGFAMIALGSAMDTGLTHDWAGGDFLPSQIAEAIGLAFAITAIVTYTVSNITPPQAAAIAAMIQISRLFGGEVGTAVIQTFVRVREQTYSNLIGQHVSDASHATVGIAAQLAAPFTARATGADTPVTQGLGVLASLVQREAYVLAYIDAFWLIAWVSFAGMLVILFLRRPPPNPLTPPRIDLG